MIIDAWIQHPTPRMLADPIFESLRRWTKSAIPHDGVPLYLQIVTQVKFSVAEAQKVWLCGCKRSASAPFCDGSHQKLA